ncbi:MAG TPA: Gfo/Idh/MocA family oxidoreductase [Candidatus Dormibacteraeota bacterium]|jgi:predicted dehydrogenase|nr:Gfo/Idh/MocA family oxidoreductase [Candidatus Dormibacteraeota bacterium]
MSDPRRLRLGILGAANIAPRAVIAPARVHTEVDVTAVAARDRVRAETFATRYGIPRVMDSYEALIADPEIDAVYIPLPNGLHGRWTLAALEAGKHVLCEKPLAANAEEARTVAAAAERTGKVVMEAFHYRYHPLALRMHEIMESGVLGPLRYVEAGLCFPLPRFSDIRYSFALAGGAQMDAGCYAVHIVRMLGGADMADAETEPEVLSARPRLQTPEIDRAMQSELRFPAGHAGRVRCSLWSTDLIRLSARAVGEKGEMRVLNPVAPQIWHRLSLRSRDGTRVEHLPRRPSYAYQLDAFADAVLRDKPLLTPAKDSVANMAVIDAIYEKAGMPLRKPA